MNKLTFRNYLLLTTVFALFAIMPWLSYTSWNSIITCFYFIITPLFFILLSMAYKIEEKKIASINSPYLYLVLIGLGAVCFYKIFTALEPYTTLMMIVNYILVASLFWLSCQITSLFHKNLFFKLSSLALIIIYLAFIVMNLVAANNFILFSYLAVFLGMGAGFWMNKNPEKIQHNQPAKIYYSLIIFMCVVFLGRGVQIFFYDNLIQKAEYCYGFADSLALKYYQKAWRINPEPAILETIGEIQLAKSKNDKEKYLFPAFKTGRLYIFTSHHNPKAYLLMGKIYQAQEKFAASTLYLEKALKANNSNEQVMQELLETDYLAGNFNTAISRGEKFIEQYGLVEINDGNSVAYAKIYDYLGDAYFKIHNKDKAKEYWEKAVATRPSYNIATEKLKKLGKE